MRFLLVLIFLSLVTSLYAQEDINAQNPDTQYLEDQFYLGTTFNILFEEPDGVTQRNLSYGLMGGFIKDIPVNAQRNVGFGIGLGYAINSYYTNLRATETATGIEYSIIGNDVNFKRNKIETHSIEMPIEFRWRTSDPISYRFWRIYGGVKLSYVFSGRSKFVSDTEKIAFSNGDVRSFQYGLMLNIGYSSFNIHAYYSLQDLMNAGVTTVDGDRLGLVPFNIGLIFYIL